MCPRSSSTAAPPPAPALTKALLLVGLSGFFFAGQGACLKRVLAGPDGIGAFEVCTVRGLIQMLGSLLVMARVRPRGIFGTSRRMLGLLFARAIIGFGGIGFAFASMELLPLGDASALMFISPIVSTLVAWRCLGETIGRVEVAAMAGAIVGVVLVARPPALGFDRSVHGESDPLGVVLALSSAACAGCAIVLIRALAKQLHWSIVLLWQAMGQLLLSRLVVMPVLGRRWIWPRSEDAALMSLGGALAFVAQMMMTKGLSIAKVGPVTSIRTTNVLAAFLLQALVTAEPVRPLSAVGAVAISSSVVLILLNARRRAPPPLATADAAVAAAEEAELADVALRDDSPGPPRDDSPGVVK